jgi:hypothetical protein
MDDVRRVLLLRCVQQLSAVADVQQSRTKRLWGGGGRGVTIPRISEHINIHLIADFYSCSSANIVQWERNGCKLMVSVGATITTVIS